MKYRLSYLLASAFYLGCIPGAPGTYASVVTTCAYYGVFRISSRILPELHLSAVGLISILGVLVSAVVSRHSGQEDPSSVVIDEVAGQLLTFWLIPMGLTNLALGTCLFRVFDIWKPYPIRRMERLPDGVGIMADDLMAGLYANLCLQGIRFFTQS